MGKNHIKRISAPKTWPLNRKENTFIKRPHSGNQSLNYTISVSFALRDMLGVARTSSEITFILRTHDITVNGTRVHDEKRPLGFMDVLSIPLVKQQYRLLLNKYNKLFLHAIAESEVDTLPSKVRHKTIQQKNKILAHLQSGHNVEVKNSVKPGDLVVLKKKDGKFNESSHVSYAEGSLAYIIGGRNVGSVGTIKQIVTRLKMSDQVRLQVGDNLIECIEPQLFIIGKDKPVISIPIHDHKVEETKK